METTTRNLSYRWRYCDHKRVWLQAGTARARQAKSKAASFAPHITEEEHLLVDPSICANLGDSFLFDADSSARFDISFVDFYSNRAHDDFNRDHNSVAVFLAHQNTFHTSHWPMLHSNSSAGFQIRVRLGTSTVHYPTTQSLQFPVIAHSRPPD